MIISNADIPAVEKLHYLKNHVTGEAARRISNFAVTSDNFTHAWDALVSRYENKRILVSSYLDALFNAPAVTRKSAEDLKLLIATVKEALGGLKSLSAPVEQWDYLIVYFVAKRLDPDSREAWELQQGNSTEPATFAELEAFLDGRTRALEMVACSSEKSQRAERAGAKSKAARTHLASSNTQKCSGCSNAHYITRCPEFYAKSVGQRREFVNEKRLCYNCLGQHKLTECRTTKRCRVCQGQHHTLLHLVNAHSNQPNHTSQHNASPPKPAPLDNIAVPATTSLRAAVDYSAGRSQTLLATALVDIITTHTQCITARALLDQGSELTFVREKIAQCTGIDLILGADIYGHLLRPSLRSGESNQPVAQSTVLGWILSGPTSDHTADRGSASAELAFAGTPDNDLSELLCRFWANEEVPSAKTARLNDEDEGCERHFLATTTRNDAGRYTVRLPFKTLTPKLGSSYVIAQRVLTKLQRRLADDLEFSTLYTQFLNEYETLNHMSRCPENPEHFAPTYYLPHHGVTRETSTTTKLRVVFNGSCQTTSGKSLNECLCVGPKLQLDIFDVLLRWRRYRYVFCADIEKMYRQILIHPDDRRFQKILWSPAGPPATFQLNTVTYGLACAPYLALRVIRQLAHDEGDRYLAAREILLNETYVDDVLSGDDDVDAARNKANQVDKLLMAGSFKLQKWTSNEPSVLDKIDNRRRANANQRDLLADPHARALGLSWGPEADSFFVQPRLSAAKTDITKRAVLSRIAQIYDPLGWITPVTIAFKILLQDLWRLRIAWDEPVPPDVARRWQEYDIALDALRVEIPRWLGFTSRTTNVELHGFSDASQSALGVVVYARVNDSREIRVRLIAAKSKVAPLKKLTIPRLELSAAVLLARLVNRVKITLNIEDVPTYLWVDSSVTLAWIQGHPSRWKEFVANRVTLIRDLVPYATWRHIPGIENPADCASRGMAPSLLPEMLLWWVGPPWLTLPSASWPCSSPALDKSINLEERHPQTCLTTSHLPAAWDLIRRYSKFSRLIRITAWLIRAVSRFQNRSNGIGALILTPIEIRNAEFFWIKHTQAIYFTEELSLLSRGDLLTKQHSLLRLAPFIDGDGLLRVGGRLRNSSLDPDAKHPVLLPRDSTITNLILQDMHLQTIHGGVQLMLAVLRQRFWILGGRAPVASFIRRCVRCTRYRAVAAKELMGQLPSTRVTPSRPFLHAGVDYAGPFLLRTWRGRASHTYKGFLIVFVCFTTSAVHLEVATDYSAQGFIAAYKRFTGRRGVCASLTSDCGTNFIGADKELRRMFDAASKDVREISNAIAFVGTEWRFNPPAAPHFGGKWEAAVKSVKYHLRRLIGDSTLTYEEFNTLLIQIEAILNSRPLSPLSDDPCDLEALTPFHFLIGSSLSMIPEPSLEEVKLSRLSRWQMLQQIVQRFWRRWAQEYLQRLQSISKWRQPGNQITVGDLVLLMDERFPPSKWPLGRITQTHAGKDGLIRVVTLRTATSEFKRPIVKLCPLPVAN